MKLLQTDTRLGKAKRTLHTRLITYVRSTQMNRIYGRKTIWK
jgi:hypothetical protein